MLRWLRRSARIYSSVRFNRRGREMVTALDRYRGCLLGLPTGDALGTTLEFQPPGTFQPVQDLVGGGPFGLAPGQWTDDTSMALCLAESLIERGGFDPVDQMERYVRWYRQGHLSSTGACFDIGLTTLSALQRFERERQPYCGSTDANTAGNGSLMRLAPVPLFYAGQPTEAIARAGESSRLTHAAPAAVDACRYFGGLLVGAVKGAAKEELLAPWYSPSAGEWQARPLAPEVAAVAAGSFKTQQPAHIRGTGYVVASLEAALWAFATTQTFATGCLAAVNLGDDADTTGAIYGQLAGAFYGEKDIPEHWRRRLALRDVILDYADRLYLLSCSKAEK
jgi:ADP-ribosyl-[dinitrogen reductase] hydrolase